MKDIVQIRIELSKMNCRTHLKLPEIIRNGEVLVYHTCCDDFKKRLETRFDELLAEAPVKRVAYR